MQSSKQDNNKRIHKRRSKQEIDSLINDWEKSGTSIIEFCKIHQIPHSTFNTWLIKKRKEKRKENSKQNNKTKSSFIPLKVSKPVSTSPSNNNPLFEVVLTSGSKITFYKEVDPSYLRSLLS